MPKFTGISDISGGDGRGVGVPCYTHDRAEKPRFVLLHPAFIAALEESSSDEFPTVVVTSWGGRYQAEWNIEHMVIAAGWTTL